MKQFYTFILLIFIAGLSFSQQLNPFTLTVTPTPESCRGNGALTFETEDTTPGATITYSIYELPNTTTAIETTTESSQGGLSAGDYRVVATQSLTGFSSNQSTANVTIANNLIPLEYGASVTNEMCGADGVITLNVTSGNAPYEYQILGDNNTILQNQETNSFEGLVAGQYLVRVVDACGEGVSSDVTIQEVNLEPTSTSLLLFQRANSCSLTLRFLEMFSLNHNIETLNRTYQISYTNPDTGDLIEVETTNTSTVNTSSSNAFAYTYMYNMPNFPGQTIEYTWKTIDQCGTERTGTQSIFNNYVDREIDSYVNIYDANDCGESFGFKIRTDGVQDPTASVITNIVLTEVPSGVDINSVDTSANAGYAGGLVESQVGSSTNPLVEGIYRGTLTVCGDQGIPFEYNYQESSDTTPPTYTISNIYRETNTCEGTAQQFRVRSTGIIDSARVINPPSEGYMVPRLTTDTNLFSYFYLYDYPVGQYQLEVTDVCSVKDTLNFEIIEIPALIPGEIRTEYVCGGFNLIHQSYPQNGARGSNHQRYLQIYDDNLGGWTTPKTDITRELYQENYGNTVNLGVITYRQEVYKLEGVTRDAPSLNNEPNIELEGRFRVIEQYRNYLYNEQGVRTVEYCSEVISEFENLSTVSLANIYSFRCDNGTYNVGISANGGVPEYIYQIVRDRNSTSDENVIVDNGSQQLFTDLPPGYYNFRIIDSCGNLLTEGYDITTLGSPQITTTANCETQEISFQVNGVDYLDFEWYKEGAPDNILSVTNELNLGTIEPEEVGTYFLNITSPILTACVDITSQVSITANPFTSPIAGDNFTIGPVCPQAFDLVELIEENNPNITVDSFGRFEFVFADGQTVDNSGPIVGDTWFANLGNQGTYTIRYIVEGLCGGSDEASITIITEDTTAPTITSACPDNIIVNATSSNNTTAIDFTAPTFEDNCGLIVRSNYRPGDEFPVGETEVTYTATDGGGNSVSCTFTVTVNRFTCVKPPTLGTPQGTVNVAISNLNRDETNGNFLERYNDAWLLLESRTKGMVITRVDDTNHPENIVDPVAGMIVFDIDENCMKLYNGTAWGCIARGCDE